MRQIFRIILGIIFYTFFTTVSYAIQTTPTTLADQKTAQVATSSGGI